MSIERFLRSLHSWMGALILPWVFLAGLTGLYMNHGDLVLSLFPSTDLAAPVSAAPLLAKPLDAESALAIAQQAAPGLPFDPARHKAYLGRDAFQFTSGQTLVVVDSLTGSYWIASGYERSLHAADGTLIDSQTRWGRVLSKLHRAGWLSNTFGTWPADIAAAALMLFAASGLYLFVTPRLRRWRNKRARNKMAATRTV